MVTAERAKDYLPQLKWLPLAIVLVFGYRVATQFRRLGLIAKYLKDVYEEKFIKAELGIPGWENYLETVLRNTSFWKTPRWAVGIFWFLLGVGSVIIISRF